MTDAADWNKVDWNDDNVALLKRLWADGGSFTEIAQQIPGATRNCVAGKVYLLGLPSRKRGGGKPGPRPASAALAKSRTA